MFMLQHKITPFLWYDHLAEVDKRWDGLIADDLAARAWAPCRGDNVDLSKARVRRAK
jgi:hypothetical protein